MDSTCFRYTELPGSSRLFLDYLYAFEKVAGFYSHRPVMEEVVTAAQEIQYPEERRAALVAALLGQNGPSKNLDRLAEPGTVVVVTGQQVGLFSGPAYTIFKALTAVKVAAELTSRGVPAVPVFWLATEDHDFAEISKVWTFNSVDQPVSASVTAPAGHDGPVGPIALTEYPIKELKAALAGFDFAPEVVAMVEAAYQPGRTLGDAFRALLRALMAEYNLLYLDPLDPAIRKLGTPFLQSAIAKGLDLYPALLARTKELEQAGYHAQVLVENQTSLFFLLEGGQRIPLKRQGERYLSREGSFSADDLIARAAHVSPNALLRPVMQDYLMPTAAYIGGPAELAYFAQSEVLYRSLLGRMPVMMARNGFTLLDARSIKLMNRYGFSLPALFKGDDLVRDTIASELVPAHVKAAVLHAKAEASGALESLARELEDFDKSLAIATAKSRAKILYQLGKIERKTARETLRRDERATADAAHLSHLLFPHKHLQERFYSILPFLAKHGVDLIGRIAERTSADCADHQVIEL